MVLSVSAAPSAPLRAQETALPETAAKPVIKSFTASSTSISKGQSDTLTASFSNGKGTVSPGSLTIVSGKGLKVTPSSTTTYTLKVKSTSGVSVSKTLTVKVSSSSAKISSFAASPTILATGQSTALTAVFSNGAGVITPGNVVVTSGQSLAVTPQATTTYVLTVTSSSGHTVTSSVNVQVAQTTPSAPSIGTNIGWVTDWDPTQMFADAMKQARKFGSPASPYDEAATVDALGWPTQDAGVLVLTGNQGAWSAGTYALSFTGQAAVASWGDANVTVGTVSYDSPSNTSAATVTVGPKYAFVYLVFTQTQRTPDSAVGSGVTNISLMRPSISGTPLASGTVFTDVFLNRLKYFSAVRMMDYLRINDSTEANWSDRATPAYASQQEVPPHTSLNMSQQYVTGGSYEYVIQLANQANKDLWISVPHLAFGGTYQFTTTQWAENLALLMKYGSDASGNPYTGLAGSDGANPQPDAGPVNHGLNPGLHVYVEYSNEFWSGVGNQTAWIMKQAQAAIAGNDPDLDWDGDKNTYDLVWRINAKGTMLIANAFADVYGADAFGSVYRPMLAGQIANSGTFGGLSYLDSQHGGANQFIWAIAGAPYADFSGDTPANSLSATQVLSGMQTYEAGNVADWIAQLALLASTEKLPGGMMAYEGGQGALFLTKGSLAAQTAEPMRSVLTSQLDTWFAWGGGPFFYYKLCSADMWGLGTNIAYDIDADSGYSANPATSKETEPKWGAIKQVATGGH